MSLEPVPGQDDSADCEVALHAAQGEHVASAVTEQAAAMKLPALQFVVQAAQVPEVSSVVVVEYVPALHAPPQTSVA